MRFLSPVLTVVAILWFGCFVYSYTSNSDARLMSQNKSRRVLVADNTSFWVQTGGPLGPRKNKE